MTYMNICKQSLGGPPQWYGPGTDTYINYLWDISHTISHTNVYWLIPSKTWYFSWDNLSSEGRAQGTRWRHILLAGHASPAIFTPERGEAEISSSCCVEVCWSCVFNLNFVEQFWKHLFNRCLEYHFWKKQLCSTTSVENHRFCFPNCAATCSKWDFRPAMDETLPLQSKQNAEDIG